MDNPSIENIFIVKSRQNIFEAIIRNQTLLFVFSQCELNEAIFVLKWQTLNI